MDEVHYDVNKLRSINVLSYNMFKTVNDGAEKIVTLF